MKTKLLFFFSVFFFVPSLVFGSTLFENYTAHIDVDNNRVDTVQYWGQLVVASSDHTVSRVDLQTSTAGVCLGNVHVDLYVTNSHLPVGSPLGTSSSVDCSTLGASTSVFHEFDFSPAVDLSSGVEYIFVLSASGETSSSPTGVNWYMDYVGSLPLIKYTVGSMSWSATGLNTGAGIKVYGDSLFGASPYDPGFATTTSTSTDQTLGSIDFGLAIILWLMATACTGLIWNSIFKKK